MATNEERTEQQAAAQASSASVSSASASSASASKHAEAEADAHPQTPQPIPGFLDFGHLPLERLANTRDLGGMPTQDGRVIRQGRLIRSGALHHASKEDLQILVTRHKLKNVVDLRTKLEASHDPDPTGNLPGVSYRFCPVFSEEAAGVTHGGGLAGDLAAFAKLNDDPLGDIASLYRRSVLSEEGRMAFSNLFDVLLDAEEGATLWHCTEGKDRTGMAAFLIELTLGVSLEDARRDYLATNLFAHEWVKSLLGRLAKIPAFASIDLDLDAYLFAYTRYIDTAINAVAEEYGSLERYLHQGLGIDDAKREQLKESYLEIV